ncbi:PAC2 family protein [Nesterenkonia alba]|uniref:PAC2 family protein n=1 Tax=Nesterenkonia alba TaxID=515814 RepID=UPI0003B4FE1F|nr:PAC2 family protein [Nesterenkonia alba]
MHNHDFDLLHLNAVEAEEGQDASSEVVLHEVAQQRSARGPAMLVSIAGHTDAGRLSEQLSEYLLATLPNRQVASFDVDAIFDYRSRRPQLTFTESRFSDYRGPALELYEVEDSLGRKFLLLTGDEPDFQWERITETLIELVKQLGVRLTVFTDALGLPAPHTRPLGVTAHGNRPDLIEGISTWQPNAHVEAGLVQVLEARLDESGHDVVGYTVHVPHYLAAGKYPPVAVAALEYAGAAGELMLPTDELREAARMVDSDISEQVSQNPQIAAVVEQLERNFDQYATPQQRSLLVKDNEAVPDAEELGAAVEEYLRTQPGDVIFGQAAHDDAEAPSSETDTSEDTPPEDDSGDTKR